MFMHFSICKPASLKESILVVACQKGDQKAQEMLYNEYANMMYRLVWRYVKSQADAEDIVMTGFVRIFKGIGSFQSQGPGSFEGWMRKVMVNESLMWLRKQHNFHLTESIEDTFSEPDLEAFRDLEAEDIYQFIARLPTGYRTVFNLFVIEGYEHREIADMLRIQEVTSRSQLFKAKALLKKMLIQEGFHYGT